MPCIFRTALAVREGPRVSTTRRTFVPVVRIVANVHGSSDSHTSATPPRHAGAGPGFPGTPNRRLCGRRYGGRAGAVGPFWGEYALFGAFFSPEVGEGWRRRNAGGPL